MMDTLIQEKEGPEHSVEKLHNLDTMNYLATLNSLA
jgi:hypothetical protein